MEVLKQEKVVLKSQKCIFTALEGGGMIRIGNKKVALCLGEAPHTVTANTTAN